MGFEYSAPIRLSPDQQERLAAALVAHGYELVRGAPAGELRLRLPGAREGNCESDVDIHFDEGTLVVVNTGTADERSQLVRRIEAWLAQLDSTCRFEEL